MLQQVASKEGMSHILLTLVAKIGVLVFTIVR